MKADGSGRAVLTHDGLTFSALNEGDSDGNPQFSPDGDSIVFDRDIQSGPIQYENRIMVMDRDGGSVRPLFPDAGLPQTRKRSVGGAVWSADSSRIFLIRATAGRRKYTTEVMSIKPDGTNLRRLGGSTARYGGKKISGSRLLPFEITPSPVGGDLLVSYSRLFGGTPSRLYLMDPDTGKRKLLKRNASSGSFSPDGKRIVFVSERDRINKRCYEGHCSFDPQLYVMKANGSGARHLVPGAARGSAYDPDWSASGDSVAFTTDRTDPRGVFSAEVFSIRPDGRCLTRLTNGSPSSESAVWGPEDGTPAGPGRCGDVAPGALAEITPEPHILDLKLPPMWLGSRYRDRLLTEIFKDGRGLMASYEDCEALRPGKCSPPVSITSGPVCERISDSVFYDGTFRRLVKRGGALVMLARTSGEGVETIAYSGGTETGIYTREKFRGRKVKTKDRLAIVDRLRPVTSAAPVDSLKPAVFTLGEVKKARAMVRSLRKRGTLAAAARSQGMFPQIARAYLRLGKSLGRIGKVLTVKCKGHTAVPGSVKRR